MYGNGNIACYFMIDCIYLLLHDYQAALCIVVNALAIYRTTRKFNQRKDHRSQQAKASKLQQSRHSQCKQQQTGSRKCGFSYSPVLFVICGTSVYRDTVDAKKYHIQ